MSDFRVTLRQLRQSPAHVAACLLSLAVGMAVCVAVFSAVNAMVFSPIPGIVDRQHLLQIRWTSDNGLFTKAEFDAIEAGTFSSLTSFAAEGSRVLPVMLPTGPASIPTAFASARYFETLGTRAIIGRQVASCVALMFIASLGARSLEASHLFFVRRPRRHSRLSSI